MSLPIKNAHQVLDPLVPQHIFSSTCALGVMIKAPRAGSSKTRLAPPLTPKEAAELSACFLRDTAANIEGITANRPTEGVAVYTPAGAEELLSSLLPARFRLLIQRGDGFGERLLHAAEDLLHLGYQSLCLVDSDSPTLPPSLLVAAVNSLSRPGDRVVLGESDDGGYYLIGLKKVHSRLFSDIDWSTARVLEQTVERAVEINLEVEILPAWYDVDCAATLRRLCEELFATNGEKARSNDLSRYSAPHTEALLRRFIADETRARIWPGIEATSGSGG